MYDKVAKKQKKLSIKNKIKHQVVFLESMNSMSKDFKLVSSMKVPLKFGILSDSNLSTEIGLE